MNGSANKVVQMQQLNHITSAWPKTVVFPNLCVRLKL